MGVKKIPLSGKHGEGKFALVDADDYERLAQHTWHYARGYAYRTAHVDGRKTTVRMHREVMDAPTSEDDSRFVDHINRDTLDNRKANLRFVTAAESAQNQGGKSNAKVPIRGVYPRVRDDTYRAEVQIGGKRIYVGSFETVEEAAEAVRAARAKHMTHAEECAEGSQ